MNVSLLHHALGVRPDHRTPFRNHFVAGEGHHDMPDLVKLVDAGYMVSRPAPAFCAPGDMVFHVTEAGEAFALGNLPQPPKRTKYDEYLDADTGLSYQEWLGITPPRVEHDYERGYRYTRFKYGNGWSETIQGDWKPTKGEAKASYKAALKKHQDQVRAWMKPEAA